MRLLRTQPWLLLFIQSVTYYTRIYFVLPDILHEIFIITFTNGSHALCWGGGTSYTYFFLPPNPGACPKNKYAPHVLGQLGRGLPISFITFLKACSFCFCPLITLKNGLIASLNNFSKVFWLTLKAWNCQGPQYSLVHSKNFKSLHFSQDKQRWQIKIKIKVFNPLWKDFVEENEVKSFLMKKI